MGRHPRRFIPRLEAFDPRVLPSVTVSYSPTDGLLSIQGDDSADAITITDTGKADAGSVTVFDHGAPVYISEGPVTRIQVFTFGGDDTVDYWLSSDLLTNRTVTTDLGDGNDAFTAHLNGQNVGAGSDFVIQAVGVAGKDKLTLDATGVNVGAGAHLTVDFQGGRGHDGVVLNYSPGVVDPTAVISLTAEQK